MYHWSADCRALFSHNAQGWVQACKTKVKAVFNKKLINLKRSDLRLYPGQFGKVLVWDFPVKTSLSFLNKFNFQSF